MRISLVLLGLGWGNHAFASTFAPAYAEPCKRLNKHRFEQFLATEAGLRPARAEESPWYRIEVSCVNKVLRLVARHRAAMTLTMRREIAFDDIPSGEMSRFAAISGAQMFELLRSARSEANHATSRELHLAVTRTTSILAAEGVTDHARDFARGLARRTARWHEVMVFGVGDAIGSAPGVAWGAGVGYTRRWAPWLGLGGRLRVTRWREDVEAGVAEGLRYDGVFTATAHRDLGWGGVHVGALARLGVHDVRPVSGSQGIRLGEGGLAWWAGPAVLAGARLWLGESLALGVELEAGWSLLTYGADLNGVRLFGGQGWWGTAQVGVTWRLGDLKVW